jgi:asparagine synthase (glutamine-hydrolysing)
LSTALRSGRVRRCRTLEDAEGLDREFLTAFETSLVRLGDPLTLLYSGGLDSSLVAFCLGHLGRSFSGLTLGVGEAPDVAAAEGGAAELRFPLRLISLSTASVRERLREGAPGLSLSTREPNRSVRLALLLGLEAAGPTTVVCGQGADELFGGYAHFRGLSAQEAAARRELDLRNVLDVEWPWFEDVARGIGSQVASPYLDASVLEIVTRIPVERSVAALPPKAWLREVARAHGLSPALADRPKRAFQYGSGVARSLRGTAPLKSEH